MITLYTPGTSWLHRLAAGPTLLLIAAIMLAISLFPHTPVTIAIAAAVVIAAYLSAHQGFRGLWRQIWSVRWLFAATVVFQLIFLSPQIALVNTSRVVLVVLLAALISLTTPTSEMLATLERALRPLRFLGVNPEKVALLLALTITVIPVVLSFVTAITEAHRARGARLSPRTLVVPLLVCSMKYADELGDALVARGAD